MSQKVKMGMLSLSFFAGAYIMGIAFPAAAAQGTIIGKVSSVDETSGVVMMLKDNVQVDAHKAKIRVKGVKKATIADIADGDMIEVQGSNNSSGIIKAKRIKAPVKLSGYDGKITGTTENVNTSSKTFGMFGQDVNASNLSGVSMSGRTIPFTRMVAGVNAEVYLNAQGSGLYCQVFVISSSSCTHCHGS